MTPEQHVAAFAPKARILALRYRHRAEVDDLVQVAMLAAWKAAQRYNEEHGVPFHRYAERCAEGELRRYLRDTTWRLHVPRSVQERWIAVHEAEPRLAQTLGHTPTTAEIAADVGCRGRDVDHVIRAGSSRTTIPIDLERDDQPDGERWGETMETLLGAFAVLTPNERQVAAFVLLDDMRQEDIAAKLGVAQVTVSRWWLRARAKLRVALADAA